jgi:3-hydroxybutyryl-CoA dehydratase
MKSYTFNEVEVGQKFSSYRIKITDFQIFSFAGITLDYNPLHVDDIFSKRSIFKSRIAHGMLISSIAVGISGLIFAGTAIALLESSMKYMKPVKVGETIWSELEIINKKASEKYNGGIITFSVIVKKEEGEVVAEGSFKVLVSNKIMYED